jgi:hypothetical protein
VVKNISKQLTQELDLNEQQSNKLYIHKIGRVIIMAEIKFEIIEHIGVISESAKGWTKELNLVSWNGKQPKYDLRDWAPNKEKMGKGITLTEEELNALKRLLNS